MKSALLVVLGLMLAGLSGCDDMPFRDRDGGYQRDRDHRDDSERGTEHRQRDDGEREYRERN